MDSTLINCEDEKIQFLNQIQDFGYLIGLSNDTFETQFYSENIIDIFGDVSIQHLDLVQLFELDLIYIQNLEEGQYFRKNITLEEIDYHLVAYNYGDFIYLELEKITHRLDYSLFFRYAEKFDYLYSEDTIWENLVHSIKIIIDYDRVMVYKFLDDKSGIVVAEEINEGVESYLGMHFPEFDIPIQARKLYLKKKNRLVSDVNSKRVNIKLLKDVSVDLTYSEVRALSPVHIQYLKNFNSQSSFSISIIVEGKLWGLVACQAIAPKHIPITIRKKAEILTSLAKNSFINLKNESVLKVKDEYRELLIQLKESLILSEDFNDIISHLKEMLGFINSDGFVFLNEGEYYSYGDVPDEEEVLKIKNWADTLGFKDLFYSHSFYNDYSEYLDLSDKSAGISFKFLDLEHKYFLIWFRGTHSASKTWAGYPAKELEEKRIGDEVTHHYSPRKNFDIWVEEVETQSLFWDEKSLIIIEEINKIIIETITVKSARIFELYKQLQELNTDLENFSHTVSHDLRAPLTVVKLSCQLLERNLKEDKNSLARLKQIISEVDKLSEMLNDILELSRTKKADLAIQLISTKDLISNIVAISKAYHESSKTEIEFGDLIDFYCDKTMAYEIFLNIISNAIKYSLKKDIPKITINSWLESDFVVYSIKDNGIGIKDTDRDKMFKLFSRMENTVGFKGTGVGLSIVHRMFERLDGSIDYISEENKGTEFILKFRNKKKESE